MKTQIFNKKLKFILPSVIIFTIILGFFVNTNARDYEKEINDLASQIQQYKQQNKALRKRANSLKEELNLLSVEKKSVEDSINKTISEIKLTDKKIEETNQKIKKNKETLGVLLVKIYISEDMSTLERLASSKNLADFIDNNSKMGTLHYNIGKKIKEIKTQRKKLKEEKTKKNKLLEEKKTKKHLVIKKEQEKNDLLSETQNSEAIYKSIINKSNKEIDNLREQQRLANLSAANGANLTPGDPNKGGYPAEYDYPHAKDSLSDKWGMYNRECVSYTAWRVHRAYLEGKIKHDMPYWGGRGNANQWPSSAKTDGIPIGFEPKPNSVAIWMNGEYGHAMWVEYIKPNGKVHVSQYNFNIRGYYSELDIDAKSAVYIYF